MEWSEYVERMWTPIRKEVTAMFPKRSPESPAADDFVLLRLLETAIALRDADILHLTVPEEDKERISEVLDRFEKVEGIRGRVDHVRELVSSAPLV